MVETAQSVVVTAQRGLCNCAAAQLRENIGHGSHLGSQCFRIYLARYCLGFELYTLDQFNFRDTFIGQEKHDKETFSTVK